MNSLPTLLAALLVAAGASNCDQDVLPGVIRDIFGARSGNSPSPEASDSPPDETTRWESFFINDLPILAGQKPCNGNGSFSQHKSYAYRDKSNDDTAHISMQKIIERSKYEFENHYVIAKDGYITQMIRIINPLADRAKLKQPPVMLMHGGTIDPTAYVWASSIQHHPEKYPRTSEDGPITSWNRSLGFTLANNGYDVWLVGTRGSDTQNAGRLEGEALKSFLAGTMGHINTTLGERVFQSPSYWKYSFNEIISNEFPAQIKRVLELTGSRKVSVLTYSFSTIIAFSLFSSNPEISEKVHNHIALAPIINDIGTSKLLYILKRFVILEIPNSVGTVLVSELLLSRPTRDLLLTIGRSRRLRYSVIKSFFALLTGSSGQYRTFFEPTVLGHILQSISYMQIKHFCQQVIAKRLQKYDYGKFKNKLVYGQEKPPVYNISNQMVENFMLVSASNDILAPPGSVKQILETINPKPLVHIDVQGYSHLDLSAAFDNDVTVNLPVLRFLDQHQLLNRGS